MHNDAPPYSVNYLVNVMNEVFEDWKVTDCGLQSL
jgi:hypothetical protein